MDHHMILLNIQDATSFRYKRECSLTGSTGLANTLESSQTIYTLAPIGRKEILWLTPSNVVRKLRALQALSKYYRIVRSLKKLSKRNKISKQGTMPTWRNRRAQSTRTLLPRLTASVSNWPVRQTELTSAAKPPRGKEQTLMRGACECLIVAADNVCQPA